MSHDDPSRIVTVGGECFEAAFMRKESAFPRDGSLYLFHLIDLKGNRGMRLVSLFRSGPAKIGIQNYDARIEAVRLNTIRRLFDKGVISFDAQYDEHRYQECQLDTEDFQKQPIKSDSEIRQYIIHKAFWLSYRYPRHTFSDELYPIKFDEAIDLEYLGAAAADLWRILLRLRNQGLLEKIMEGNGRPSEKLLAAYESDDFASLGMIPAPQTPTSTKQVAQPKAEDEWDVFTLSRARRQSRDGEAAGPSLSCEGFGGLVR